TAADDKAAPMPQPKPKQAAAEPQPKQTTAEPLPVDPKGQVSVAVHRQGANLRLDFPFPTSTPAALFRPGNALLAVFDSQAKLNIGAVRDDQIIKRAALVPGREGEILLRLVLDKQQLVSFFPEGTGWVLIVGDNVAEQTTPVSVARSIVGKGRSSITIP